MLINEIHESWNFIIPLLYEEPLKTLNNNILPSISFQPKTEDIFNVFKTPLYKIKVVILGQDPYPNPGYAIGKAFAVTEDTKIPASLRIIQKEIFRSSVPIIDTVVNSFNNTNPKWRTLDHWSSQGVFLLNTALTVETGNPGSHMKYWNNFTKHIIMKISVLNPCIWLLWGNYAQSFIPYIENAYIINKYKEDLIKEIPIKEKTNYILTAAHPAAESYRTNAGFLGCNHFIIVNEVLKKEKNKIINF